mgnify:FL=1
MGFSILYGEKYIITSGEDRVLERVFNNKPVWVYNQIERIKTFNSITAANNFFIKNNLEGSKVTQIKDKFKPVFNILFNGDKIECYLSWSSKLYPNASTQFDYDDKENALKELNRLKLIQLQRYQDLIMYSKDLNLPEFNIDN